MENQKKIKISYLVIRKEDDFNPKLQLLEMPGTPTINDLTNKIFGEQAFKYTIFFAKPSFLEIDDTLDTEW